MTSEAFRQAFLAFMRKVEEDEDFAARLTVASIPKTDDSAAWWASWNVKIGGRTYALNLIPLSMLKESSMNAETN